MISELTDRNHPSRVYLGIGSNLPDRNEHLDAASRGLEDLVSDIRESRRYESRPRYNENQPPFLNSVLTGIVTCDIHQLLDRIHEIEAREGRNREAAGWKGPRPLDIDILLFGEHIVDSENLTIPHPGIYERKFVLLPLLDLDPAISDPVSGIPLFDFFTKLDDQGIYYYSLNEFETT